MTPTQILALINQYIVSNGVGAITAPILNNILTQIVNLFSSTIPNNRIVSASTALTLLATDVRVGFLRTLNLAPTPVQLLAVPAGYEVILQDLAGNFSIYPLTISPPFVRHYLRSRTSPRP